MNCNTYIHRRRSIRLKGYDYSQAGAYFVTVCAKDRECMFGDIVDGEMQVNDAGRIIQKCWDNICDHFPHVELDEFIVMPNHIHGITLIVGAPLVGAPPFGASINNTESRAGTRPAPTLGNIIGEFKSITTRQSIDGINQKNWPPFNGKLWQRNYYEHVIRDENDIDRIRQYIIENPAKWAGDEDNPGNVIHCRGMACHAPAVAA